MKRKSNPYYVEDMGHLKVNVSNLESIDFAMERIGAVGKERVLALEQELAME